MGELIILFLVLIGVFLGMKHMADVDNGIESGVKPSKNPQHRFYIFWWWGGGNNDS